MPSDKWSAPHGHCWTQGCSWACVALSCHENDGTGIKLTHQKKNIFQWIGLRKDAMQTKPHLPPYASDSLFSLMGDVHVTHASETYPSHLIPHRSHIPCGQHEMSTSQISSNPCPPA